MSHVRAPTSPAARRRARGQFGVLGLRIFEATGADIADLGEEHGHRVLLLPLPPAVRRAIDRAVSNRTNGPILLNTRRARMDCPHVCCFWPSSPDPFNPLVPLP